MFATLDTRHDDDAQALDTALHQLVGSGQLSDTQAQQVHEAFVSEHMRIQSAPAPATTTHPSQGWASRLIEVGAYLGAALVAAGTVLVVRQQWHELGHVGQLAVLGSVALVLGVTGMVVAALARRRGENAPDHAVLRRLSSTLLTLAAAVTAGFVLRAFMATNGDVDESRVGWMFLTIAATSGLILVATRVVAPSAFAEIGLFGALLAVPAGIVWLAGPPDSPTLGMVLFYCVGIGYAALAILTRMVTVPTLGIGLGLATALIASVGDTTTSRVLLLLLAAGCFAGYLARPRWPLVTTAMVAAVAFTFSIVGDTFGPAVAMLVAGLVLLVLTGVALLLRRGVVQRKQDSGVLHEVGRDGEGVEDLMEPEPRR